ncbi:MAG: hypothetical protein SFW62_09335 [Alphaproteobacteria bacterium]|nr:hypothetical protein [Alphaproteobacteria bacterium]
MDFNDDIKLITVHLPYRQYDALQNHTTRADVEKLLGRLAVSLDELVVTRHKEAGEVSEISSAIAKLGPLSDFVRPITHTLQNVIIGAAQTVGLSLHRGTRPSTVHVVEAGCIWRGCRGQFDYSGKNIFWGERLYGEGRSEKEAFQSYASRLLDPHVGAEVGPENKGIERFLYIVSKKPGRPSQKSCVRLECGKAPR